MDLSDVKTAIIKEAPGFGDVWVRSFDWRQNGDVVTAKPRYPISEMCHQTMKKMFKRLGGKYVSDGKGHYFFQLVLKQEAEQNGSGSTLLSHSPMCKADGEGQFSPVPRDIAAGSVFRRLENQLRNLTVSGIKQTRRA